jgi:hypothetical protein
MLHNAITSTVLVPKIFNCFKASDTCFCYRAKTASMPLQVSRPTSYVHAFRKKKFIAMFRR